MNLMHAKMSQALTKFLSLQFFYREMATIKMEAGLDGIGRR
jgi:hypothetical protein